MAAISIRFADIGWPIISPLISAFSSHWSNHCDLIVDDERMISAMPGGVRERAINSLPAKRSLIVTIPCGIEQRQMALAFAWAQIGKPYDYGAVLSFGFGAPWNADNKWFCSELCAAALAHAGIITVSRVRRISPGDLARLISKNGAYDAGTGVSV